MFVEIRKQGKKKKYYLIHTYREWDKVKRISRYLGSSLNIDELEKLRQRAEQSLNKQIEERDIFDLSEEELNAYRKYENEIRIEHLQSLDWLQFTEQFTYNTNAIEGSTVVLSEVKDLIEKKDKPKNDDEFETLNVAKTIDFIRDTKEKFSLELILKLHNICFKGTKSFAGKLRNVEVVIRDSYGNIIHKGAPFRKVKTLLMNLINWYEKHHKKYPILLLAALTHNQFENIHPFQDGNGRVGRLLLNYILLKHNYPPINILMNDRQRYYLSLQKFEHDNDIKPTLRFLLSQYRKQYNVSTKKK
ncbi:MAG: Fic family protein [Nanoarchaeota archaeon]|nr:Fic family protein [Nanoarchaeota archaeon]